MFLETLLLAAREIRRNVLRSSLTILGVVIGVAAVITMVTVGNGATARVTSDISSLGSNLLIVRPGQHRHGPGGTSSGADPLRQQDLDAITTQVSGLAAVAPLVSRGVQAVYADQNWSTSVSGTTDGFFQARNWGLTEGRQFTEGELRGGAAVCILGQTVRSKLFGAQNPLGAMIRLEKLSCHVIGLLESKGQSSFGTDMDDLVLVPLRTFQRRIAGNVENIGTLLVSAENSVSTEKVQRDIEALLRQRRHIAPGMDDDFWVMDMKEIAATVSGATRVLTGLLGAVAAVSLLVGGIGIMNIMLVSVTERTREIGTRLAIGALARDVLLQFLVEAVVLSSLGGVVGILLGLGGAALGAHLLKVPFVFNPGIVAIAFVFSAAVGVVFGYFPARQAARLNPIEALRHE
ncbi:MAG TPA: ABC transporter permease [bacterium]|nr:ABC transporter permease [bacterium]